MENIESVWTQEETRDTRERKYLHNGLFAGGNFTKWYESDASRDDVVRSLCSACGWEKTYMKNCVRNTERTELDLN